MLGINPALAIDTGIVIYPVDTIPRFRKQITFQNNESGHYCSQSILVAHV